MDDLRQALERVGFSEGDVAARLEETLKSGVTANGGYDILLDMRRDLVSVFVEQTTVRSPNGPTLTSTTYPKVCIVESPDGRIACDPDNVELVLSLVGG